MGLFDFLKTKSTRPPAPNGKAEAAAKKGAADKTVAKYADAISRKAQNYDRQEALDALSKLGTADAAVVLLKRFTFVVDPSITDQEEKETAFRGVVAAGVDALPAIREFCARAESLTYPLKMMRELLDDESFVTEVHALLAKFDTEYDRNPDPKTQLIETLERTKDPRNRDAVERFLEDFHEPTRFHAVTTLLVHGDPEAAGPLVRALLKEEGQRTVNRIAEGLAERGWTIPEELRGPLENRLPRMYSLVDGVVTR